jgi:diacylglycerol kinase (ATP)
MSIEKFSIRSRLTSFRFAFKGLVSLLANEHNSRIHLVAAIMAISAGLILKITTLEWAVIIIVIGIVFIAELLNSSIEALSDIVRPEYDEDIRKAKDYAAGAVLISALVSVIAGGLIFIPAILKLVLH